MSTNQVVYHVRYWTPFHKIHVECLAEFLICCGTVIEKEEEAYFDERHRSYSCQKMALFYQYFLKITTNDPICSYFLQGMKPMFLNSDEVRPVLLKFLNYGKKHNLFHEPTPEILATTSRLLTT